MRFRCGFSATTRLFRLLAVSFRIIIAKIGVMIGAQIFCKDRLAISDRNLIIVGMDFAEGEESVAITAIFDKGRLK